jgi:hypothetical protein
MSYRSVALLCCLCAGSAIACAVGVDQRLEDGDEPNAAGGTLSNGGTRAASPQAGSASSGAGLSSNPFGGTATSGGASTGGQSGASAGGAKNGGGASGSAAGAGDSGADSGGSVNGTCACPTPLTWMDNTVLSWAPGDCLSVGATTYLYTGTKAQTYANGQCNPGKQEAWCTDSGNDYKFMVCPP